MKLHFGIHPGFNIWYSMASSSMQGNIDVVMIDDSSEDEAPDMQSPLMHENTIIDKAPSLKLIHTNTCKWGEIM